MLEEVLEVGTFLQQSLPTNKRNRMKRVGNFVISSLRKAFRRAANVFQRRGTA